MLIWLGRVKIIQTSIDVELILNTVSKGSSQVMETSCTRYRHIYVCTHRSHQQYKSISTSSEKNIIHYSYMMIQNRLR